MNSNTTIEKHAGIRIDRIPVDGAAGLVFVLGMLAIGLLGHPAMKWLLLISLAGGVIGSGILITWRKYH